MLGIDGPGQGEALLLDGILWTEDFPDMIGAALDVLAQDSAVDTDRVGLFGISIGGMWALRAASADPRIRALYDLGGPINTRTFSRLPFLIKTKMCQVTGARDATSIAEVLGKNSTESDAILSQVACAVRIMHGGNDRVVSVADKEWLRDKLSGLRPRSARQPRGHPRRRPLLHGPCGADQVRSHVVFPLSAANGVRPVRRLDRARCNLRIRGGTTTIEIHVKTAPAARSTR